MADLNLDIHYFEHLKTKRLVARLGRGSDVLPLRLFCYTAKHYAKDGRLTTHTVEDIEAAVGWWGKRGECTRNLHEVGFLDLDGDTYVVHGWEERSGHLSAFARRAKAAAEARWGVKNEDSDATAMLGHAQASASNAPTYLPTSQPTDNPPGGGPPLPEKPKRKQKKPEGPLRELTDYFVAAWKAKYKARYPFRKLDGIKSAELLTACGGCVEDAKAVIDRYLNDEGVFYRGHPLALLTSASSLPKFIGDGPPKYDPENAWKQPVTQEVIDCYLGKGGAT